MLRATPWSVCLWRSTRKPASCSGRRNSTRNGPTCSPTIACRRASGCPSRSPTTPIWPRSGGTGFPRPSKNSVRAVGSAPGPRGGSRIDRRSRRGRGRRAGRHGGGGPLARRDRRLRDRRRESRDVVLPRYGRRRGRLGHASRFLRAAARTRPGRLDPPPRRARDIGADRTGSISQVAPSKRPGPRKFLEPATKPQWKCANASRTAVPGPARPGWAGPKETRCVSAGQQRSGGSPSCCR